MFFFTKHGNRVLIHRGVLFVCYFFIYYREKPLNQQTWRHRTSTVIGWTSDGPHAFFMEGEESYGTHTQECIHLTLNSWAVTTGANSYCTYGCDAKLKLKEKAGAPGIDEWTLVGHHTELCQNKNGIRATNYSSPGRKQEGEAHLWWPHKGMFMSFLCL